MHEQATTFIVCQLTAAILIRWGLYREYIRINSQNKLQKANTTGTRHWPLKTSPEITPGARLGIRTGRYQLRSIPPKYRYI